MLATLIQTRREAKIADDTVNAEVDAYLIQAIIFISERIRQMKEMEYEPRRDVKTFDALGYHVDDSHLYLWDSPLLEAVSITDGQATALEPYVRATNSGDYLLPGNHTPYDEIVLVSSSGKRWTTFNGDFHDAIEIDGYWGYRSRYAEAWVSANDTVQNNPLTANATTITVVDAEGADVFGITPRFSPGQLLRMESEFVRVTGVNTATNVLTVRRGQLGTTAAAHAQSTAIALWIPEPTVTRACLRWAAFLYSRRGQFENATFQEGTTIQFPKDAPEEVLNILAELSDEMGFTPV